MTLRSYSSLLNVGHKAAREVFDGPVVVEEKIDGSQFSFGVSEDGETMHCRSKGATIHESPDKLFALAVETAHALQGDLQPGWTYRGEAVTRPRHNSLTYGRIPAGGVIIFDIDRGDQDYLSPDEKRTEAGRLGLEVVPTLFEGLIKSPAQFKALLPSQGILGGAAPEGIVAKNYARYTIDHKVLMTKYVTDDFKEVHRKEWKRTAPSAGDFIEQTGNAFRTAARWQKAVQHLREAGQLADAPQDIGNLMKEVIADVERESTEEIKDALWEHAWPKIRRRLTAGLPEWYKDRLLVEAFPASDI